MSTASALARGGVPPGFPPLIGADLLRALVPMADAIETSRRGFAAAARSEVTGPLRSSVSGQRVLVMPAEHASGSGLVKIISLQPDGWERGLPSISGCVLWIDGTSGLVSALLDATSLTALRTGAASGLATDLLAPPECPVLAMIGAGGQAADQVSGVCAVRHVREVRVYSRRTERSRQLCARLETQQPGVTCRPADTITEAVRGADVVCTATRSTAPLFNAGDLQPRAHVNAIGAYRLDMCELPPEAFGRAAAVVVDQVEAITAEAGDVVAALHGGHLARAELIEIGRVVCGEVTPAAGLTIFKSVGIAAQDWALGELAVRRAWEAGALG